MDTLLQGGLKTDSNSSLVVLVSGNPGSGKTSFALALSAVLSPFGTQSFYLSVEEKAADLKERLQSLYPEYLTGLSFYKDMDKEKEEWFWPTNIPVSKIKYEERFEHFDEMLRQIGENLNDKTPEGREKALPAVCPLIIVIDSIRPFIRKEVNLEGFIERCRNLNAVVILVSSSSKEFHHEIDYMVDVVINLEYSDTETPKEKPVRILQLLKTRRQISRPGAHVFHLSGNGIHVSPQLPSQIDKIEIISRPVPSSSYYIDFYKENCTVKTNLVLWDESQILLHGYGSTGKAGLALHLLMYPLKIKKGKNISDEDPYIQRKRKVLVVSLLYPPQYYKGIERYMKTNAKFQHASLECICFYSGYLTPEDFISKILAKLDTAILEGAPFTGILLDGLHNAPLQFPRLQAGDMVWSTLYSLIAKYCLTIVTTFTNFKIEKEIDENGGILLKDDKLLLNIMIQAADYYFHIQKSDKSSGKYIVTLNSAIRHRMMVNPEHFLWDREDFKLGDDDVKIKDKQKNLDFED
jgi:KaiC/GvpD/RAD55 family RecA-like ATPase